MLERISGFLMQFLGREYADWQNKTPENWGELCLQVTSRATQELLRLQRAGKIDKEIPVKAMHLMCGSNTRDFLNEHAAVMVFVRPQNWILDLTYRQFPRLANQVMPWCVGYDEWKTTIGEILIANAIDGIEELARRRNWTSVNIFYKRWPGEIFDRGYSPDVPDDYRETGISQSL